jgi:regulator of ribonuclease activity A
VSISTPDLCDEFPELARVFPPIYRSFGGRESFEGTAVTVRCFEDNSKVKELVATPGDGRVMVIDGGGSLRRALLGDMIAAAAESNGWEGFIIHGAVRDVEVLRTIDVGVKALGSVPLKTQKLGAGVVGLHVEMGGVTVYPSERIYADATGIVVLPA